jgi:PAS domain S-box-containing protein
MEMTLLQQFYGVWQNAALLVLGVLAYSWLRGVLERWPRSVRTGVEGVFGFGLTVLCMSAPLHVSPGVQIDSRNAVVALVTVFGSPFAGAITAVAAANYRLWLGGVGAVGGAVGVAVSFGLSLPFWYWLRARGTRPDYRHVAALALAIGVALLIGLFAEPHAVATEMWQRAGVAGLTIVPASVFVMGVIMVRFERGRSAERRVAESEARFRALVEHSADVIFVIRPDGTMTYRSPSLAAAATLGYAEDEVIGKPVFSRLHPDDAVALAMTLEDIGKTPDGRASGRTRGLAKDGSLHHLDWTARNVPGLPGIDGIIVTARDVTAAVTLQEQLQQAQKMEAIGQLAGGIAHDFNNLLGAVLGFAGFLLQDLPEGSPQHGFARRIVTASQRGKEIVEQILAFARSGGVERKPTDLAGIVHETRDLLRASLPSSTKLELLDTPEELVAEVNAAQVGQVLLNLCLNANQALHGKPGNVSITLSRMVPGAAEATLGGVDAGENRVIDGTLHADRAYAKITVTDTGIGMTDDVLRQIFHPFFTTKARGQGTGLGLAVVHGVVRAYDGACVVTSRPGAGSVFALYLPLATEGAEPAAAEALPPEPRGHERVLIVDDDGDFRDVLSIGLDRLGYEVAALDDPEAALAAFAEHPEAWDVVISDQIMSAMTGVSLLERLKALRPGLCFLLCSGDGGSETAARSGGAAAFFMKPVSPEEIAKAIRRMIDAPQAVGGARTHALGSGG